MKPEPLELFSMYHLGVSPQFETRFYNLHSVARHYGVPPDTVQEWLATYHMESERLPHIDYNVAQAHANVQALALTGSLDDIRNFCKESYEEFVGKLDGFDITARYEDVDYEDLWGDKEK